MPTSAAVVAIGLQVRLAAISQISIAVAKAGIAGDLAGTVDTTRRAVG